MKAPKKDTDDMNWFGTKLGAGPDLGPETGSSGSAGGVGRYLNLKRPLDGPPNPFGKIPVEEGAKKRKLGFGDFEGW
jgi:peptidyl-prolyl cis-trans isomerase-like protein 2